MIWDRNIDDVMARVKRIMAYITENIQSGDEVSIFELAKVFKEDNGYTSDVRAAVLYLKEAGLVKNSADYSKFIRA
jgi:GTP:adenosylcobinamide-phosphate guanylyltransferase